MQKQKTTGVKLGGRDASKMAKSSQSGGRSKSKLKTSRKPLRDVAVKIKPSPTLNHPSLNNTNDIINNTKSLPLNQEERQDDESLDRLLLIHSDLSSLLHQV